MGAEVASDAASDGGSPAKVSRVILHVLQRPLERVKLSLY
jgi:hypothetical protein